MFDLLRFLVANGGRLLQKDELLKEVWPDTFVEEGNLNRNISTLRKALGEDSAGKPTSKQFRNVVIGLSPK